MSRGIHGKRGRVNGWGRENEREKYMREVTVDRTSSGGDNDATISEIYREQHEDRIK